jgi:CRP/FNR family transcriptional regulator, nitrogen fixation regulation protein
MQSLTATRAVLTNPAGHMAIRMPQRPARGSVNQIDLIGTEVAFAKNGQFYCEGEPSTYLYKIVTGMARSYRMTAEGRRHIVAFYVPGDLFGFETGNTHTLCAEAVTDARVRVMKRASILNRATEDFDVAEQLWLSASGEIRRNQEHILQFGSRSARARVASFLLEMVRRIPSGNAVALSISRQDIADYLDLRIETVSRAATRLARLGAIAISSNRKITVRNSVVLTQLLK